MRQQWNDKRLNFKNRLKGGLAGGKKIINFIFILHLPLFREDQVLDPDGRKQGVDAGHLLQEREDRAVPQHPHPQPLHQDLSRRRRPLQHQVGPANSLPVELQLSK